MKTRMEKDTIGEISVQAGKYWKSQTQRSLENFNIGSEMMPLELIYAYSIIKESAAQVNHSLGLLTTEKMKAICKVTTKIRAGELDEHFPLKVWQTGSGTQTNMNVNEVISYCGNEWLKQEGYNDSIHANDDVNQSQSSNDTFPTAMHIAIYTKIQQQLLPELERFKQTLSKQVKAFQSLIKIGRTHLQDATPLTFGQEISGWHRMVEKDTRMIQTSSESLLELAIGGTAVGTGINAHPSFGEKVAERIATITGFPFQTAVNKFQALTSHDELVYTHGALKALAADLMKIANDVRWLASGPRSGIGEITIPANEPGSSIMPGKVNPTQSEALTMIVCQVMGNDTSISFAASQGNFELNVFKPVIAYNMLQSIQLLSDGLRSFHDKCLIGIKPNEERIKELVEQSLMLVTALNPHIGYENAAKIAKLAHTEGLSLKEAAIKSGHLTAKQYDQYVNPEKMV
ncbi:class II fumarate hydratase [Halalkalibacter sp. APA_J-10(15)]|uniref:class II fumarate hydratase n=1 Tax=Halalkalibacter sp. APA_J-10(15) TaxID=2933805 RepID=UPI001FF5CCCF|nr:class II fumarate hydratase [Halalkalibacter sp. APA_J-10(15)]MCK0469941.1 class II fumarate hydratase [Halalkalibacter sp. APA_J-10(15)]